MAVEFGRDYVLDEFRLEPEKRTLSRDGVKVRLANRPFHVLVYLIENRDRLVKRDELLERFWNGRDVYDEALTKCVGAIRKALKEPHEKPRFIETRWAEGYRFIGDLEESQTPSFVEIETTRAIRYVVEESNGNSDHTAFPVVGPAIPGISSNTLERPLLNRRTKVFAVSAVFSLSVTALMFYLLTGPHTEAVLTTPINSIAVLPLKNLSNNPDRESFADGMTESLISSLSRIENLKVISRNSVFTFKGKDVDPREVGRKLSVGAVLEGSIREDGEKIRVEVRLVDARTGAVLWNADNYDRLLADIFSIQDDIARSVATRLRLKLSPANEDRLTKRHTNNIEAYQAYVKGRYFWRKKDRENLGKSRIFFEEAIRLDPGYALAHAGLADYYFSGIWYLNLPPKEALRDGKAAVQKVLEIDPDSAEAHDALARVFSMEWDWENAIKEKEIALELAPNNASVWQGYAFLIAGRRPDDSIAAIKRAYDLDPLSANIGTDIGVILTFDKRYDEAIGALRKTLEMDPKYADAYYNLGVAYELKGNEAEAFKAYIETDRLNGQGPESIAACETAFARAGIKGFWQRKLDVMSGPQTGSGRSDYWLAALNAYLGEKEQAFQWLEKAFASREPLVTNLKVDHRFDSLRSDPRFDDLVDRAGL